MQTHFDFCSSQSCIIHPGEFAGILLGTVGTLFSSEASYLKNLTLTQVLAINFFAYGYGKVACFSRRALLQCLNSHNWSSSNASDQQLPRNFDAFIHSMARVASLHALGFIPGYCTTLLISSIKMPLAKALTCCICFASASIALPICFSILKKIDKCSLCLSNNDQDVNSEASTTLESESGDGYQADTEI